MLLPRPYQPEGAKMAFQIRTPPYDREFSDVTFSGPAVGTATASKATGHLDMWLYTRVLARDSSAFGYGSVDFLEIGPPVNPGLLVVDAQVTYTVDWWVFAKLATAYLDATIKLDVRPVTSGLGVEDRRQVAHDFATFWADDGQTVTATILLHASLLVDPSNTYTATVIASGHVRSHERLGRAAADLKLKADVARITYMYP
jgi:hypothetical protein